MPVLLCAIMPGGTCAGTQTSHQSIFTSIHHKQYQPHISNCPRRQAYRSFKFTEILVWHLLDLSSQIEFIYCCSFSLFFFHFARFAFSLLFLLHFVFVFVVVGSPLFDSFALPFWYFCVLFFNPVRNLYVPLRQYRNRVDYLGRYSTNDWHFTSVSPRATCVNENMTTK